MEGENRRVKPTHHKRQNSRKTAERDDDNPLKQLGQEEGSVGRVERDKELQCMYTNMDGYNKKTNVTSSQNR